MGRMSRIALILLLSAASLAAQGPGRGMQGLSPAQTEAVARLNAALRARVEAVAAARAELVAASLSGSGIAGKVDALASAETALADARAAAFAAMQSSAGRLDPGQTRMLAAMAGGGRGAQGFRSGGTIPRIREAQVNALTTLSTDLMSLARTAAEARTALAAAAFTAPKDDAAIQAKASVLKAAELALATARSEGFARIQASANRLAADQTAVFRELGGTFSGLAFTLPEPLNFAAHDGFVSIFDGKTLRGWDGNPKFWRVQDGAIVGESTPENPSGNSYIVYRDMEARDFTLKFEIKVEGSGGSGFQYRSRTGSPWLSNIPENVTKNVGPVNLNWMMTGPQADFWPSSRDWTGQFYSENTPMRILAWRGQVVEGEGLAGKRLMGNIGDRQALNSFVKMNDWNEYTVIARGGVCMHIVNGQLMAVMVDDDPESSNNQSGFFGIEIEATTKVSVRNMWVKKFR